MLTIESLSFVVVLLNTIVLNSTNLPHDLQKCSSFQKQEEFR